MYIKGFGPYCTAFVTSWLALVPCLASADQYNWIGSGDWSDPTNWSVPSNPDNDQPADGDDDAYFYQSSSVSVDESTGVQIAEFGIGTYSLTLAGTTLSVSKQN